MVIINRPCNMKLMRSVSIWKVSAIEQNKLYLPRSISTGRFRPENTGTPWNMEAVFRPENFRTFSNDFRPVPVGTQRKLTGIHRKKSGQFPAGTLLPFPGNFGVFLQDPVTFPPLSGEIRSFPEAGIIGLGIYLF